MTPAWSTRVRCCSVATVELIVDKLLAIHEHVGISYYVVFESVAEEFAPVVDALAGR